MNKLELIKKHAKHTHTHNNQRLQLNHQGPDFRKILGRSYENLRKFLRLMKILGKTYDNADFRKILRKS